ncbi:hypothetical protein, partial [Larkinella soli]|uniref:hypothetical protein n=1 Tax=Larkinella soli TaxID=1770527 RepID=UPI0013E40B11
RDRQPVSNAGTALMTVLLHYPPLLTFPAPGQTLPHQPQPAVLFQWTPRNAGTVAFSGLPLYTFRLWELRDEGQDANAVALSQPPLYEETTAQPSLFYGPALPPLQAGMRYGWQVQAFDERGQDLYVNQGLSQVATFTAGLPTPEPGAPSDSLPLTAARMTMLDPYHCPVNTTSTPPADSARSLADLLRSPALTRLLTDSTRLPRCPGSEVTGYSCQETVALPPPTGEPQGRLQPGEVLMIDQYKVLLTQVSGGAGRFSGQGLMPWNFAGGAFVPVAFEDLQVVKAANTTGGGCVTSGQVHSTRAAENLSAQIQSLLPSASAPTFAGTLGEALNGLAGAAGAADPSGLRTYLPAVQQGLQCWRSAIETVYGPSYPVAVTAVLGQLDSLSADLGSIAACLSGNCPERTLSSAGKASLVVAVALEQLRMLSSPQTDPSGRTTAANCQLTVMVLNPNTTPLGKQHWLMPIGCSGGTIQWSGGPMGDTLRIPLLGNAFLVAPVRTTHYTALCRMKDGSICSQTVEVAVSAPGCAGFQLKASKTDVEKGEAVTLTASGCAGTVIWSNGLGTGTSVVVIPSTDLTVTATCRQEAGLCYARGVQILISRCLKGLYLVGNSFVYTKGCEPGPINWTLSGPGSGKPVNSNGYYLESVKGDLILSARCGSSAAGPCPAVSLTIKAAERCGDGVLAVIPKEEKGVYRLQSKTGLFILTDETGRFVQQQPVSEIEVKTSTADQVYTATFANGCKTSALVKAPVYTIDWKSGYSTLSPVRLNYFPTDAFPLPSKSAGYQVEMSLMPSCPGEVVWNRMEPSPATWVSRTLLLGSNQPAAVFPARAYQSLPDRTTFYQAACRVKDSNGQELLYPAVSAKGLLVSSSSCLQLIVSSMTPTLGQAVTLEARNCPGTVSWSEVSSTGNRVLGQGSTVTVTPTTTGPITYSAVCDDPGCGQHLTLDVKPCRMEITAPKTVVTLAEPVSLTAAGCSGGQVVWDTGEEGAVVVVRPLESGAVSATCLLGGQARCEGRFLLDVTNTPPDSIQCPPFRLTASTTAVVGCTNETVTLTPEGCPAGGRVRWSDGKETGPTEPYALMVNQPQTVEATCTTPYGIASTARLAIQAQPGSMSVVHPPVYAGFPTTLMAYGCPTTVCGQEGTYTWDKWNSNDPNQTGSSIEVVLTKETEYKVTCNDKSVRVKIPVQPVDCAVEPDIKYYSDGTASISLKAGQCDVNRPIVWRSHLGCLTDGQVIGRDVDKVRVKRPASANGLTESCDGNYSVVCYKNGFPCSGGVNLIPLSNSSPPLAGGSDPEPPKPVGDPCEKLRSDETKTLSSPDAVAYLNSRWCPGRVNWYRDAARSASGLVCILTNGDRYSVGRVSQPVTYYYDCTLKDGNVCQGSGTLQPAPDPKNARLAAIAGSAAGACTPLAEISKATVLQVYYGNLLCQARNLYVGDSEKAFAYLESLKSVVQSKIAGMQFPADLKLVADVLAKGECDKAAQLLAQANSGTMPVAEANRQIISTNAEVKNETVEKIKRSFYVIFRAFIPQDRIEMPEFLGFPATPSGWFFGVAFHRGDNRMEYQLDAGKKFRTEHWTYIDFLTKAHSERKWANGSEGLDKNGKVVITSEGTDDCGTINTAFCNSYKCVMMNFQIDAVNKAEVKAQVLFPITPKINANVKLKLTPLENGTFDYNIEIPEIDGFPAYEMWIVDNKTNNSYLLFRQNPIESKETPLSLFGSGEHSYLYSGNSSTLKSGKTFNFSEMKNIK